MTGIILCCFVYLNNVKNVSKSTDLNRKQKGRLFDQEVGIILVLVVFYLGEKNVKISYICVNQLASN